MSKGRAGKLAVYTAGNSRVIGSGNFDPLSWNLIKKNFAKEKRKATEHDHSPDFDLSWCVRKAGSMSSHNLSREERQVMKETEEEVKRQGGFSRVFPTPYYGYYKQFFS